MTGQALIILALLIPAIGVILIALTSWQPNLRETTTLGTAVTLFGRSSDPRQQPFGRTARNTGGG